MRKLLTLTVMGATALSSIVSTAAWADATETPIANPANATTLAAMAAQCSALAATYVTGNQDRWTGEVVEGDITLVAGPTETGNRVKDLSSVTPIGDFVPSVLELRGEPYRIGGSVNMFADQWATAGYYPDSTYNYTADFLSTFAHAFDCNVYQEVWHDAVNTPPEGYYTNNGTNPSDQEGSCQGLSPANPHWGTSFGNCTWHETAPGVNTPAGYDDPDLIATVAGVPVNQDQTDNLDGFEPHGGRVDVTGEYYVGHPVVCISPSKPTPGGTWRAQNGYSGANCTTTYFKTAPIKYGTEYSQGTFTSVPNYTYP